MLRKLYMTGIERSSRSFSLPQAIENSRQFCFSEQIFYRKQSLGRPCAIASLRESLLVDYNLVWWNDGTRFRNQTDRSPHLWASIKIFNLILFKFKAYLFDVIYNSFVIVISVIRERFPWWFDAIAPVFCHVVHPVVNRSTGDKCLLAQITVRTRCKGADKHIRNGISKTEEDTFLISIIL